MAAVFVTILRATIGIMSFICYGYLFEAYENESCGQLSELVLAYVILMTIGLGLLGVACIVGICFLGCAFGSSMASQPAEMPIAEMNQDGKYKDLDAEKL